ncbi:hypothetical protein LOK49_LG06G02398 [Camellia lanceoleosa]|uniref:Uncharacterized protein n=1 Tax=Camellia lanceoleosa TaxID=1840588 RepID=A0ACC0H9N3_9ERIC|nr:hypothetical protein LOK49_LG06G02398 [Camellia lanceoleosa]
MVARLKLKGIDGRAPASGRSNNVGKGSRQNGSVTSGKGLALRNATGSRSEPVGLSVIARASSWLWLALAMAWHLSWHGMASLALSFGHGMYAVFDLRSCQR